MRTLKTQRSASLPDQEAGGKKKKTSIRGNTNTGGENIAEALKPLEETANSRRMS